MSDDAQHVPSALPEPTDVRFDMRTLLVAAIPVAIAALFIGPFVRGLNHDELIRAAVACSVWLGIAAASVTIVARERVKAERLAGRTFLRMPIYGTHYPFARLMNRVLGGGVTMSLGLVGLYAVAKRAIGAATEGRAILAAFSIEAIAVVAIGTFSMAMWWWSSNVRLCETGAVWDRLFLSWTLLDACSDPACGTLVLTGTDQNNRKVRFELAVPETECAAVVALLRDRLKPHLGSNVPAFLQDSEKPDGQPSELGNSG